jgi:hypothetical protein
VVEHSNGNGNDAVVRAVSEENWAAHVQMVLFRAGRSTCLNLAFALY